MNIDATYQALIKHILTKGFETYTRQAYRTRIITYPEVVIDSCPLITVRKTAWKTCLREWEWFMSGSNDIKDLHPTVRPWWTPWIDDKGCVADNYSIQFRDHLPDLIKGIREHPYGTRNVMTTWVVSAEMKITNCHGTIIQVFVDNLNRLHIKTYQRSCDVICGLPHNWLQYWAFLMWLAAITNRKVGTLIWVGGDIHIYSDHYDIARRLLDVIGTSIPNLLMIPNCVFQADNFALDRNYDPVIKDKVNMII